MSNKNYDGNSIKVLHGLDGIRERFSMYVGSIETAANHLVNEVIDNCIDEFLNGYATNIKVTYNEKNNEITIIDNGRGIPIDIHPVEKKPTMEVLFTNIHAGGKFDKDSFKISGGLNGVGVKCVTALSSKLVVKSYVNNNDSCGIGTMEFSKGKIVKSFEKFENTKKIHGTFISFIPDKEILGEYAKLDMNIIKTNLEMRTYSNAGLKIEFVNGDENLVFYNENGIQDYIEILNKKPISNTLYFKFISNSKVRNKETYGEFEIVMNYGNTDDENIISFVNAIKTSTGTHETGFKMALTKAINDYIKENKLLPKNLQNMEIKGEDIRSGLFCIMNIKYSDCQYKSQTKDELSNPEIKGIIQKEAYKYIKEWLDTNKDESKKLCNRIIMFAKGRENANKYKEKVISLSSSSSGLKHSSKYKPCISTNPEEKRIYFTEGD